MGWEKEWEADGSDFLGVHKAKKHPLATDSECRQWVPYAYSFSLKTKQADHSMNQNLKN